MLDVDSKNALWTDRLGLLQFGISISKNAIYSHNSAENEDGLDLEDNDR